MKVAIYTRSQELKADPRFIALMDRLAAFDVYQMNTVEDVQPQTDLVLSIGGDGTFLSASKRVGQSGIPILGVNLGRLGFLSEYSPEEVGEALPAGRYTVEDRTLLETRIDGDILREGSSFWPYTLNEVAVHRGGAAILGVDIKIDGNPVPTYWADGLLVSTSSGSTAYSLSVGGPICMPEAKVLIIAPIAPHNLNVRPLIVPDTAEITLSMQSRDEQVMCSMDNRNLILSPSATLTVKVAQFSLKRVRLAKSNFVKALTTKLFWGEDVRNGRDL
jgi:NAD+ kinase